MSQPFGYDEAMLAGILLDARRCNKRDGITGALVCRHDIYLQLLEGPAAEVHAAYARIERDDRHAGMAQLVTGPVTERIFGEWEMLHDPAQSWIWSEAEIADGALDRATPDEIKGVFETLAGRVTAQS
jgi:hypothetical protein